MIALRVTTAAALLISASLNSASAQSNDPGRDLIRSRAVEAVIWGMPAVNYDLMLQAMLAKTAAKQNEFVYWSKPVDWKNQTLTPNPDALYFMTFFDTKAVGPVVIEVPPADKDHSFAANIDTVWQMPLEDAGPYGADKGKGGRYLIMPPGYARKPPPGYIGVQSDTYAGYGLLRVNLTSHGDAEIAKAAAYGRRLKIYPLAQASRPPETKFTDANGISYDSTIPFDIKFFQSLDRVVQTEPWQTRDKAMIDQLRSIGIEKGRKFQPDDQTVKLLESAASAAREIIDGNYEKGFPRFFQGSRWAIPAFPDIIKAGSSGYAEPDSYPVDHRAITYSIGYIGIKRLGTAQTYLIASKDKDGATFDGRNTYRLHVPANVPVKQYWSVTAYDRQTHALIKNLDRASRASNLTDLKKNSDGSVDVYFGPQAPAGNESNWVPTAPDRQFELLFRLYAPTEALFEKKWILPDVEKSPG